MLGLLAYLLPLYGLVPGRGLAGATERAPGIVFARYRQADLAAAADERPVPRPFVPALSPVSSSALTAPEPATCSGAGAARSDLASRPPSPGGPRSPPVL
jgi:hypothetical protein